MEALVLIEEPSIRDLVLVGLRNVPGIHAESPSGFPDVDRAKRRSYDAIFLDHEPNRGGAVERLERLREIAPQAEIVVVAEERVARLLANERARLRLAGFLTLPVDVSEFFRLATRLRKRAETVAR
ncbi:MAG: hypothetical protein JNJ88_08155 [Planctomycetes bacterium]|nr:hypothetical protein [Planctomycetota bacterium]